LRFLVTRLNYIVGGQRFDLLSRLGYELFVAVQWAEHKLLRQVGVAFILINTNETEVLAFVRIAIFILKFSFNQLFMRFASLN